jgi:ankyrin repeat protein
MRGVSARWPRLLLLIPLGIVAIAAYGLWQGTPQDVVGAVRRGDVPAVSAAIARDPAAVHIKVYPQAFQRVAERRSFEARFGRSPWEGRYLIHDAVEFAGSVPLLDALAGADLAVRLNGATLLHLAARKGDLEVATWLLGRGADVHAANDCTDGCAERGQTPLHDGLAFRDDKMSELLLGRGARVDALRANGQSPLHLAGATGRLTGAFVLCRHGADPARLDAAGKTPYDLAQVMAPPGDAHREVPEGQSQLLQWLKPEGGCATVAATARSTGTPVSDDDARAVFAKTVIVG